MVIDSAFIFVRVTNQPQHLVYLIGIRDCVLDGCKVGVAFCHEEAVIDVDTATYAVDGSDDLMNPYCHDAGQ